VIQPDGVEPVAAQLHTNGAFGVPLVEVAKPPVSYTATGRRASLCLLELIAVLRVVEQVGKVREQVETVVQQERCRPQRRRPA
jgi:hypothetical protein